MKAVDSNLLDLLRKSEQLVWFNSPELLALLGEGEE